MSHLQQAAALFCEKHGLPPTVIAALARHIDDNLDRMSEASSASYAGGSADQTGSQPLSTADSWQSNMAGEAQQNEDLHSGGHADWAADEQGLSRNAALERVHQLLADAGGPFEYQAAGQQMMRCCSKVPMMPTIVWWGS